MLLSTIINEFKDRFFRPYNKNLLPGHIKALESMALCRHEHGPHMRADGSASCNGCCGSPLGAPWSAS